MARRREDAMKDLRTHAGFPIKPVYGPDDLTGRDVERDVGRPGEYPFTRGIHAHMYRERLWTMRQYIGFGTPAETNARFKYLMAHGQDALNVAFDLPTQLGDRKSTRLNSSHQIISYAVFCLKKKKTK